MSLLFVVVADGAGRREDGQEWLDEWMLLHAQPAIATPPEIYGAWTEREFDLDEPHAMGSFRSRASVPSRRLLLGSRSRMRSAKHQLWVLALLGNRVKEAKNQKHSHDITTFYMSHSWSAQSSRQGSPSDLLT